MADKPANPPSRPPVTPTKLAPKPTPPVSVPAPAVAAQDMPAAETPAPEASAAGGDELLPLLKRLAIAMETQAKYTRLMASRVNAPNYKRDLSEWNRGRIDQLCAELQIRIVKKDSDGPSVLEWNHHRYQRRGGKGKFGKAIW